MTTCPKALRFIESYDFSGIAGRAIKHGLAPESVPAALDELKAFFSACARSDMSLSPPSRECDELWHAFIIETRTYAAFCDSAFGEFLHHSSDVSQTSLAVSQDNSEKILGKSVFGTRAECNDVRRLAA